MIRHSLLIIYRNFKRFRSSFFINLIGLSTGLACVLFIYLWVRDEQQVDQFFRNDDRLYQVLQNFEHDKGVETMSPTPGLLAKTLADEFPEVEFSTASIPSFFNSSKGVLTFGDNRFQVKGHYGSNDFFRVFSYPLLYGNASEVLKSKESIVISDVLAVKLFHSTDNAVGKTLNWHGSESDRPYYITGVFQSPPANASDQFDFVMSYDLFTEQHPYIKEWGNSDPDTYVLLREGTSVDQFNAKIRGLLKFKNSHATSTLFAQPYADRYLHGNYKNGLPSGGRIQYVKLFSIIALFILAIACVNFMNLSTAKASRRIKEVGVKKAMGAARHTLVFQYLGESMLMSFLSLTAGLLIVDLLLPSFNLLTGKNLTLNAEAPLILSMVGIALFTGFVSGSYPALYLSGFNPVTVLKGKLPTRMGELIARKGLVLFQFTISILLVAGVWVVYQQMRFIQSADLGYQRDHIVYFDTEKVSDGLLNELKTIPGVINAARFYHDLMGGHGGTKDIQWEGKSVDDPTYFSNLEVGYDLIETMEMKILDGKPFSEKYGSSHQIIFNEAAIKSMGLKDPVGKNIKIWGEEKRIVGVVKDFHFESMYEKVGPCFLFLIPMVPDTPSRIMVRLQGGSEAETLKQLSVFYRKYNPGLVFEYHFLDEDYQQLYASEQRVATLSHYFAVMAILISCLGLFGLAAFTAERRWKEIGIRKVLGSSEWGIIYLLSSDFTRIVLLSSCIALPVSYLLLHQWLSSFAYKIPLQWWYFAGSGVVALFMAWITVSAQAFKAARVNPATCLKED